MKLTRKLTKELISTDINKTLSNFYKVLLVKRQVYNIVLENTKEELDEIINEVQEEIGGNETYIFEEHITSDKKGFLQAYEGEVTDFIELVKELENLDEDKALNLLQEKAATEQLIELLKTGELQVLNVREHDDEIHPGDEN